MFACRIRIQCNSQIFRIGTDWIHCIYEIVRFLLWVKFQEAHAYQHLVCVAFLCRHYNNKTNLSHILFHNKFVPGKLLKLFQMVPTNQNPIQWWIKIYMHFMLNYKGLESLHEKLSWIWSMSWVNASTWCFKLSHPLECARILEACKYLTKLSVKIFSWCCYILNDSIHWKCKSLHQET